MYSHAVSFSLSLLPPCSFSESCKVHHTDSITETLVLDFPIFESGICRSRRTKWNCAILGFPNVKEVDDVSAEQKTLLHLYPRVVSILSPHFSHVYVSPCVTCALNPSVQALALAGTFKDGDWGSTEEKRGDRIVV